jgi:type III pantothenate kinase
MPGISTSADALFSRGARLARVEIAPPERTVGRNTEESIRAGVFLGAVEAVDGLVRRIVEEMDFPEALEVVATGGFAEALAAASRRVTRVDATLTLTGIRMVWEAREQRRK